MRYKARIGAVIGTIGAVVGSVAVVSAVGSATVVPHTPTVTLAVAVDVSGTPSYVPPLAVTGNCGGQAVSSPASAAQFVTVQVPAGSTCNLSHIPGDPLQTPATGSSKGTADVTGANSVPAPSVVRGSVTSSSSQPTIASFTAPSSGTVTAIFTDAYTNTSLVPLTVEAEVLGTDPGPAAPFTYQLGCGSDEYSVPPLSTVGPVVSTTVEVPSGASCSLTEVAPGGASPPTVEETVNGALPPTTLAAGSNVVPIRATAPETVKFGYIYPYQVTIAEDAFTDGATPVTPDNPSVSFTLVCSGNPVTVPAVPPNQSTAIDLPSTVKSGDSCTVTQTSSAYSAGGDTISVGETAGYGSAPAYAAASTISFNVPASGPTDVIFADVENPDHNPQGSVQYPLNVSVVGEPPAQAMPIGFSLTCFGQAIPVPSSVIVGKEGAAFTGQISLPVSVPYFPAPSNPPAQSCSVTETLAGGGNPTTSSLTDAGGQDGAAGLTGTVASMGPLTFVPNNTGAGSLTVDDTWWTSWDTVANVVGSQPGVSFDYALNCSGLTNVNLNTPAQPVSELDTIDSGATGCTEQARTGTPTATAVDLSGPTGTATVGPPSGVTFSLSHQYASGAATFTTAYPAGLTPTTVDAAGGGGPFTYTITCGNATFVAPSLGGGSPPSGALELPASTDCVAQENGAPAAVSVSVSGAASVGANNGNEVAFETPPEAIPPTPVTITFSNFPGPPVQLSVTDAWQGNFIFYSGNPYTFTLSCSVSGGSPITFGLAPITLTNSPAVAGPSTTNVPSGAECTVTQSQDAEQATESSLTGGSQPTADTGNSITFLTPAAGGTLGVAFVNEFEATDDGATVMLVINSSVTGSPPAGASPLQYTLACTTGPPFTLPDIPLGGGELVYFVPNSATCTLDQVTNDGAQSTSVTVSGPVVSSSTSATGAQFTTPAPGPAPVTVTVGFNNTFPGAPPPATTTTTAPPAPTTTSTTVPPTTSTTVPPTTSTTVPPTTSTTAPPPPAPSPQSGQAGTIEVLLKTIFAPAPLPIVHAEGLGSAPAIPPAAGGGSGPSSLATSTVIGGHGGPGGGSQPGSPGSGGAEAGSTGAGLPGHPQAAGTTPNGASSPAGRNAARVAAGVGGSLLLLLLLVWLRRRRLA